MCGIAGYSLKGRPPEGLLEAMAGALRHRGPDGEGYFAEEGVGLGHRRLSIIDVDGGAQPITNEDGSVAVVYNGEIYNYLELREGLMARGHRFSTRSDTEVLVHLYEEEGEAFLPRLNGIFAFALYDRRRRRLLLARDPVGVKPLYYAETPLGLLFASEPKALAACPFFERSVDIASLWAYLTCEYVPSPFCIFKGARKLPPGHHLIAEGQSITTSRYWDWALPQELPKDRRDCAALLKERILKSVRGQLISDVPLGVFLSGGTDSSIVASAMAAGGGKVESFSIGFQDPTFDESMYALGTANHLGTAHHNRLFGESELLDEVPKVLAHMDEPMADPSLLPTALLSRYARERVTVALAGDGGDELFGGYPTYWVHGRFGFYRALPAPLRRCLLSAADRFLPVSHANLTFAYKLRKFRDGAEAQMPERHFQWMGALTREAKEELLGSRRSGDGWGLEWVPPAPADDPVTAAQWLDFHTYLVEDILAKVDRAGMMASLEARVPLLDPSVVRLAFSIPWKWRLDGRKGKAILKEAFAADFPAGHFDRPKKGFGIPLARWLCGPLRPFAEELLSDSVLGACPHLSKDLPRRLWREHLEMRADHRKPLWTLFCFLDWWRRFGAGA